MQVVTEDFYQSGFSHRTIYHWWEARDITQYKAVYGNTTEIGNEQECVFKVEHKWSFHDPRKTQELRSDHKQQPTAKVSSLRKFFSKLLTFSNTLV